MEANEPGHEPVLISEVIRCLQPENSGVYVDCTFGRGGYSKEILKNLDHDGRVLAMDTDPDAIAYGNKTFEKEPRLILRKSNYDKLAEIVTELGLQEQIKGIVFDLGVSSPQLDDAGRGFSFRYNGPLDMRMNPEAGMSAREWINSAKPGEIRRVIRRYGEEPSAGRISRKIVDARENKSIDTTAELAEIVYRSFPERERRKKKIHPATKVFQAIRMHVNDELAHLEAGLQAAMQVLPVGANIVVVSFHSLEDRLVKRFFRYLVEGDSVPDKVPLFDRQIGGDFEYVCKLFKPSGDEVSRNPRARSARLRAIRRFR